MQDFSIATLPLPQLHSSLAATASEASAAADGWRCKRLPFNRVISLHRYLQSVHEIGAVKHEYEQGLQPYSMQLPCCKAKALRKQNKFFSIDMHVRLRTIVTWTQHASELPTGMNPADVKHRRKGSCAVGRKAAEKTETLPRTLFHAPIDENGRN
jgi:hypothetical protein